MNFSVCRSSRLRIFAMRERCRITQVAAIATAATPAEADWKTGYKKKPGGKIACRATFFFKTFLKFF